MPNFATGHSLWLMPEGEVFSRLRTAINFLSGSYGGPLFDPHVTLAGGVGASSSEVIGRVAGIASVLPLKITLTRMDFQNEYFRAIALSAAVNPELLDARRKVRLIFGRSFSSKHYEPHLSLWYGCALNAQKKRMVSGLDLCGQLPLSFAVRRLDVMVTEGPPEKWFRIKSFVL